MPRDRGEAPLAFRWKGKYWLLTDLLGNNGLGAYRSDDALSWARQPHSLLDRPGTGTDDQNGGHHPEVVLQGEGEQQRAYLYYFVHPGVPDAKRSAIQVTELRYVDGWLSVDRNAPTYVDLRPGPAATSVRAAPSRTPPAPPAETPDPSAAPHASRAPQTSSHPATSPTPRP